MSNSTKLWILVIVFVLLNVWIRAAGAQGWGDPLWGYDARPGPRFAEPRFSPGPDVYFGPPVHDYRPSWRGYNTYSTRTWSWRNSNYPEYNGWRGWVGAPLGWRGGYRPYRNY